MRRKLSRLNCSGLPEFFFGAPYYPEHWNRATREQDPEWMREAGFNVVRMAEFAWDMLEPREGEFDFSFFDAEIARLGRYDINTFLATPTAAPPRWLTLQHPDILRVDAAGRTMIHGSRQHVCTTSPRFREYSRRITAALAAHYADHPRVIGFQTDNEFNCHFQWCYCENCRRAFLRFLQEKYGSVDELNRAWGNAFWAQRVTGFAEVELPRSGAPTHPNPGAMLDYRLFTAAMVTEFQREQIDILRQAQPRWIIFHNGLMPGVDYRSDFTADLDVLGFDSYPHFNSEPLARPAVAAFRYSCVRAIGGNFIIPEMQSGAGGQGGYFNAMVEPGEQRVNTFRAVAHGADGILFFRWRTCRFGAEEYWRGIIDHDNIRRRRYRETAVIGAELKTLAPLLAGTIPVNEIAVAAGEYLVDQMHEIYSLGTPSPDLTARGIHNFLYRRHYLVGAAHPGDDLTGLRVMILPHWEYVADEWVANLSSWVEAGGVLIIGARSGTRTVENQIVPESFPGALRELAGVTVADYGSFDDNASRKYHLDLDGEIFTARCWFEELDPDPETRIVGVWRDRALDGCAAVSWRRFGRGSVFYVGTLLTGELVSQLIAVQGVKLTRLAVPETVEFIQRSGRGRTLSFILNHGETSLVLPADLEFGKVVAGGNEPEIAPMSLRVFLKE